MTRMVMVTKYLPSPADSGGKLRSLAEAVRLARIGPLTLLAHCEGTPDLDELRSRGIDARGFRRSGRPLRTVQGLLRTQSFTAARFWTPPLAAALRELASDPVDLLLVGHAQMAPYARLLPARHKVLDLHNVESSLADSYRVSSSGFRSIAAGGEAWALRRLERRQLDGFDTVLVVSERDRSRLPESSAEVLTCPNGTESAEKLDPAPAPVAMFSGLMGWAPNAEAAAFLVNDVWPDVRTQVPGARLILVGRDPTPAVRSLAGADVEVTGRVATVRPYLQQARVALAPLLAGGGSRLKILEGLAAGRPVVATTIGVEGLEDLVGHGVIVADGAAPLASAIVDLLVDPARAAALGQLGHAAVHARYGWDVTLAPLLERAASWV